MDLKPYYDEAVAAEAEVQRIAAEIDTLFRDGTDEGKKKALEMRPALDEAQTKLDDANAFYEKMQNATRPNDVLKNFIPASETDADPEEGSQPSVVKRADFDKMSPKNQYDFIHLGGTVED